MALLDKIQNLEKIIERGEEAVEKGEQAKGPDPEQKQFEAEEAERKLTNASLVRDSLGVVESVRRAKQGAVLRDGTQLSVEETVRRQLEASIAVNRSLGITDIEQKALIDQYKKFLKQKANRLNSFVANY